MISLAVLLVALWDRQVNRMRRSSVIERRMDGLCPAPCSWTGQQQTMPPSRSTVPPTNSATFSGVMSLASMGRPLQAPFGREPSGGDVMMSASDSVSTASRLLSPTKPTTLKIGSKTRLPPLFS